tara:strand:+ start:891 stop:1049 length:159 start_codon:yes stop_codon:yes gene_type:complete
MSEKEEIEELKTKLEQIEVNTRKGCFIKSLNGCAWLVGLFFLFAIVAAIFDS